MTAPDHQIEISDQQSFPIDASLLTKVTGMILTDFGINNCELSIALVDDEEIRNVNNQYLKHDYATDVISFIIESTDDSMVGQLVVSTDTADRLAKEMNVPMEHELMLYVIHGTLHLVGLDDTEPALAREMRKAEADYLSRFDIQHVWETGLEPLGDQ
jgi:probable rRNA maturation factor